MKNAKSVQNVNMCNVVLLSHSYRNLPPAKNSKNITVNYSHSNHDYYTLPTPQAAPTQNIWKMECIIPKTNLK